MKKFPDVVIDQFRLENLLPTGWRLQEADGGKRHLICDIEAIHACTTGNYNTYSTEELRKALPTWTAPYHKPILLNHDTIYGEPIGRTLSARMGYSERAKQDCEIIRVEVSDPDAIQKIRDGRYLTVSIGSRISKALCSICGQDWVNDCCEHEVGQVYDGKLCTALLKGIVHNECSFVNVPADINAQVVGIVSEGYLYGGHSLVKLSDPGVNLLERQGGMQMMEALGIKEVEQLHVLEEAHGRLHAQFAAEQSDALKDAHAEIVRQMLAAKVEHAMADVLDEALPEDLRPVKEDATDFGKFFELLAQSKRDLDTVQAKLDVTIQERDTVKAEFEQLRQEKEALQVTVEQLTGQTVAAETEIRRILAEQLVEIKLPAPENRDAAIEEYMGKSRDVLQELLAESRKQSKELYEIEDPTLHDESRGDPPEVVTAKKIEALKGLFRGPSRAVTKKKEV